MDNSTNTLDIQPGMHKALTDTLIGETVGGRYLVERELGHGGVGVVYLARDLKLHNKPVVVKVLLEKSLRDDWVMLKFLQEREALARVDHPGVVGIFDSGELPQGQPYIVMQFVDGYSLREMIRTKPEGLDFERVAPIVAQIGEALSAVHEKKIYHRDLKPENIMLQKLSRGGEQVKIVDFGIAKVKDSVIAPSTVTGAATAGTIVYMSPEQLHGVRINAASDIYSFGVIAYEMVTGRRPYNPVTVAHLSEMQREGLRVKPSDLRPRLPANAQATILKALAFEAKDRYQNAGEFGDALASALMNEETLKHHPSEVTRLPATNSYVGGKVDQTARTLRTPLPPDLIRAPNGMVQKVSSSGTRRLWPLLAIALVLGVALIGAYAFVQRQTWFGATLTNPLNQRSLAYSLTVQKIRDGKAYQDPFQSSGQEIFENGYKFRLNVWSPQSGYLYVFNEGTPEVGNTIFTIIYPTHKTGMGSAKLDASQTVQTNWNIFSGEAGTEHLWIIWSASPVVLLETARDSAFKDKDGAVTEDVLLTRVKEFLNNHSSSAPETVKDTTKQQTFVRASGNVLIKVVELEHR